MSGEQGRRTDATEERRIVKALVYGSVNALMAIPVLYGYAAIIFRYEAFDSVLAELRGRYKTRRSIPVQES